MEGTRKVASGEGGIQGTKERSQFALAKESMEYCGLPRAP